MSITPREPTSSLVSVTDSRLDETGPPAFPGTVVGTGLDRLEVLAEPWTVARAITSPQLTQQLLLDEPGFANRGSPELRTIANTLTFLFQHTKSWTLLWAESVAGPAEFDDSRTVRSGVTIEQTEQLARTVGIKVRAEGKIWAVRASAELSAQWSKLTNSTVRIDTETESTRSLHFSVPAGGRDIALWQLESRLIRRLILRPGKHLPADPIPEWVELAIATPPRSSSVLSSITRSITRP